MTVPGRNSVFWWLYVALLVGAAVFIGHSFVGTLVLGVFGYYATRPICGFFDAVVESDRLAATLTVVAVLLPVLALTLYAGMRLFRQVRRQFDENVVSILLSRIVGFESAEGAGEFNLASWLREPPSFDRLTDLLSESVVQQGVHIVDVVFGALILVSLAVILSYALLQYDDSISAGFAELVGGRDTTVYSYALAVDSDLESIFFGNLLFVLAMSAIATATYTATNLVAPPGMEVPMVFTLGVLTGIASLLPIVVGKIVYLPVVAYLGVTAARQGGGQFVFVGGVLVVYFLVLDILPQSFVQPYITGRQLNPVILLFAYILGPILFGWYGFFLMPIVFVLMLEAVRIVLPELLHGEPLDPEPELAEETGADTDEIDDAGSDDETTSNDDGADAAQR